MRKMGERLVLEKGVRTTVNDMGERVEAIEFKMEVMEMRFRELEEGMKERRKSKW